MATNSNEIETTHNPLEVITRFQSADELRKLFLKQKKTLCWAVDPNNFNVTMWFRETDEETEKLHSQVNFDACASGLIGNIRIWNGKMVIEQSGGTIVSLEDALREIGITLLNLEEKLCEFMGM